MSNRRFSRRTILKGIALTGLGTGLGAGLAGCSKWEKPGWREGNPFTLGVASGSPTSDGFVLWTRLAPDPLRADGSGGMNPRTIPVAWELATDAGMKNIVAKGTAPAAPGWGHSVHVQLTGLSPGRPYWYRFIQGDATSMIGRGMTLPALGSIDRLRLGYVSCSNYEYGYFSAYSHLADESPDAVLYLGDYIYESLSPDPHKVRVHSDGVTADNLPTYRNRYAQYQMDPNLQRLRAGAPSLVTWDDHEVENDYAGKWSKVTDSTTFLARRAAAYQAFFENMPVKPALSTPKGPVMRVYDRFDFGDLARISMIDGRQYRSREACVEDKGRLRTIAACPELEEKSRTFLGKQQEAWLFDGLANASQQWNIIGNNVMMAQFDQYRTKDKQASYWIDDWNGYQSARKRLMHHLHDARVSNPLVVTGDIHSYWASDLKLDFNNPASPVVGTEFVGTSITSPSAPYKKFLKDVLQNPHMHYFESRKRGYATLDISRKQIITRFRSISDVTDPNASISTLKEFVLEDGKPGVQEA